MRLPKRSASGTGAQCAAGVAGDSLQDYLLALVALCPPSPSEKRKKIKKNKKK